jgi:hypothetical protein
MQEVFGILSVVIGLLLALTVIIGIITVLGFTWSMIATGGIGFALMFVLIGVALLHDS